MAKKKSKKPAKAELSKKARKALEAREAELAAELKRREKKASKKGGKKKAGKKSKGEPKHIASPTLMTVDTGALGELTIGAEAPLPPQPADPEPEAPVAAAEPVPADDPAIVYAKSVIADLGKDDDRHPALKHLDYVGELIAITRDPDAKPKKKAKAAAELARLRAEGEARIAERDARTAAETAALKEKVAAKKAAREKGESVDVKAARMPDALEGETESDYQMRKLREKREAKAVEKVGEAVDALRQATEAVETETGRIFETGESVAKAEPVEFAKPSEAEPELESGRNGYKIIQLDADGNPDPRKVRQMTRVTTFVGNIDDETALKQWEKRLLAEGLSETPDEFVPRVRDIAHRRDVKIKRAEKDDRKGKLGVGEVGRIVKAAEKEAKDALNALVDEALELAGRHDKADAGTALHTLAEIRDAKGIDAVRDMRESDEITETQLASIEAYDARMNRLGAKVIHAEAVIVNDAMGYAGRLDRILMAKLPELVIGRGTADEYVRPADQRARRYVADIKSGSLEYGAGKIARQMTAYAHGDLYDIETGKRSRHSAARDVGLVFHMPQGEGVCHVYAVDLKAGLVLLKLSADVRRARNTGKKTIDLSVDIADPAAEGDETKGGE